MDVDSIRKVFATRMYARTRDTVKLDEYKAPATGQFLYVYKERELSASFRVVIHPGLKFEPYLALPGVTCPKSDQFRHGSNMRQFPKRKHRGESETPYGRVLEINSLDALSLFLQLLDTPAGSKRQGADLPARLTAIELENFKGVGKRIRIELAPITLLFGANSAGKSTILHAFQYVREVLERGNTNPDKTVFGGEYVDLGGFRNLVHKRDLSNPICVKLELELNQESLPELVPDAFDDWVGDDEATDFYNLLEELKRKVVSVSVEVRIAWNDFRQAAVVVGYEVGLNGESFATIKAQGDGRDAQINVHRKNPILIRYKTDEEIKSEAEMHDAIVGTAGDDFVSQDEEGNDELSDWAEIQMRLEDAGIEKGGQGFRQWLDTTRGSGALPKIEPLLYSPTGNVMGATTIYIARAFTAFLSSTIVGPAKLIRDELRKLRYVGPIRQVPERDYSATLSPDEARWADGTAAWETLLSCDEKLVEEVSEWMSAPDKLSTGYEVERRKVKEVNTEVLDWLLAAAEPDATHRVDLKLVEELRNLPVKARLDLVEMASGMRVQARDVGIGISQVLPVVVAALEPSASMVSIEQPELHIHPAVQVGLGDLLIDGAKRKGISFLIETHSEHLMLRLLRRIREASEADSSGVNGPRDGGVDSVELRPEDLSVVCIQGGDEGTEIVSVAVTSEGDFERNWPKGFFAERAKELF